MRVLAVATERLLLRNGHSNPFFKIATAETRDYDWVILGASHAMTLDFGDFNALMQRETGLRILNLAAQGTGPLYNRFVLEHFLRAHRTRNLLYVVDSFAFTSRAWNEDRFADAKLIRGTPFAPAIAWRLGSYVRRDGVDPRALLDYLSGFSKINNRDRFQRDAWEGEAQFDRVYRSSATAVGPTHRIPLSGCHDAGTVRTLSKAICRPDRDRARTRHPRDRRQAAGAGAVPRPAPQRGSVRRRGTARSYRAGGATAAISPPLWTTRISTSTPTI